MPRFDSSPPYEHGLPESLGVLIVNLGTPDEPSTAAVRRYLAEFLWDPRVVEVPRPIWWLILHGYILRTRPARSASAYRKIWTDQGSPLLLHSTDIAQGVQEKLSARLSGAVHVEVGMSYGSPSIDDALDKLHQQFVRRVVVLPLYPQYSGTTTASVFDAVTRSLSRRRWVGDGVEYACRGRARVLRVQRQNDDPAHELLVKPVERIVDGRAAVRHADFDVHGTGQPGRQLFLNAMGDVRRMQEQG